MFCNDCFKAYHPRYRVAHKWSFLEQISNHPTQELGRQAYRANLERNIARVSGLLRATSLLRNEVMTLGDGDTKVK